MKKKNQKKVYLGKWCLVPFRSNVLGTSQTRSLRLLNLKEKKLREIFRDHHQQLLCVFLNLVHDVSPVTLALDKARSYKEPKNKLAEKPPDAIYIYI